MITTRLCKKSGEMQSVISRAEMLVSLKDKDSLLWVDLDTPDEFETECLIEIFNFHPLAVEDCLSDHSEPKMDDYEEYLFIVAHDVVLEKNEERNCEELQTRELHIFCGPNYVVTFHKQPLKSLELTRTMAERKSERLMARGSGMLLHAILDKLVDHYQPVLDSYDRKIDQMEELAFDNPPADYLSNVVHVKRDVFNLRRIISAHRELINQLIRGGASYFSQEQAIYFRDIQDHLVRIHSMTEGFHEALTSILQAYFSYSSHKLNEIIKHMTVLATLTMPAVIIASIYGMNFQHMPELNWIWGYPAALLLSVLTSTVMLLWMRWKKWI